MVRTLATMLALAMAAMAIGVAAGSSGWGWATPEILWKIRVPRVLAGFGAGAALALAGALMQLLTRNPLADPYVLGLSGGASVGALLMLWLGTVGGALLLPEWGVAIGAGAGALAAAAVLFLLSWRLLGRTGLAATQESSVALLLVGVMIGTACSAFVSMLLVLASEMQLRGMVFWLLGDLNGATQWGVAWFAWLVALALVWPTARQLDWLARRDAWAATLGVPVVRRRRIALAAAALATGAAVATAGAIGFVGLVVPHALRLIGARPAAILLPASALGGGSFVVLADAVARTVVAPVQLPVGVIAAAVGVPSFLFLLLQGGRRRMQLTDRRKAEGAQLARGWLRAQEARRRHRTDRAPLTPMRRSCRFAPWACEPVGPPRGAGSSSGSTSKSVRVRSGPSSVRTGQASRLFLPRWPTCSSVRRGRLRSTASRSTPGSRRRSQIGAPGVRNFGAIRFRAACSTPCSSRSIGTRHGSSRHRSPTPRCAR